MWIFIWNNKSRALQVVDYKLGVELVRWWQHIHLSQILIYSYILDKFHRNNPWHQLHSFYCLFFSLEEAAVIYNKTIQALICLTNYHQNYSAIYLSWYVLYKPCKSISIIIKCCYFQYRRWITLSSLGQAIHTGGNVTSLISC